MKGTLIVDTITGRVVHAHRMVRCFQCHRCLGGELCCVPAFYAKAGWCSLKRSKGASVFGVRARSCISLKKVAILSPTLNGCVWQLGVRPL